MEQQAPQKHGNFWWVWVLHEGRPVVFSPPHETEEAASSFNFTRLGGNGEVMLLGTHDKREATRAIKRAIFDRTDSLTQALRRARHRPTTEEDK